MGRMSNARTMIWFGGAVGTILVAVGSYFIVIDREGSVDFTFLAARFSSTSVGVALAFIGALLMVAVFQAAAKSPSGAPASGGAGGDAEVVGDGEARGGKGGHSGSFGPGGKGGSARVIGTGKAVGGGGGDG